MNAQVVTMPAQKSKVLIVDDHPIVRLGLTELINREQDMAVCADAADADAALAALEAWTPDIVILDISLGGADGLELLKTIRARKAEVPVLMLSMHAEVLYAQPALRAGANGYLMKHEAAEKVVSAIRQILREGICVSEHMIQKLLEQLAGSCTRARRQGLDKLTSRELEVLNLIGSGYDNRRIAEELHVSLKTVESHCAHMKSKLALRTGRELVQHAVWWAGLRPPTAGLPGRSMAASEPCDKS